MRPTVRGSVAATQSQGVTELLLAWSQGEQAALDKLVPRVHAELRRVAHRYMARERPGHTLQTSALVNEAYLRLIDARQVRWQNRARFFAVSAQLMRRRRGAEGFRGHRSPRLAAGQGMAGAGDGEGSGE